MPQFFNESVFFVFLSEVVIAAILFLFWVILGWVAAGMTGVLLYLGFVLPTRVRKRTQ
jgi:hypothetical protein